MLTTHSSGLSWRRWLPHAPAQQDACSQTHSGQFLPCSAGPEIAYVTHIITPLTADHPRCPGALRPFDVYEQMEHSLDAQADLCDSKILGMHNTSLRALFDLLDVAFSKYRR